MADSSVYMSMSRMYRRYTTSMATPSADLIGIDRKNTLSCGAVRFTNPRPMVARNMRMITGAEMTTVARSMPSSESSAKAGASPRRPGQSPKSGTTP